MREPDIPEDERPKIKVTDRRLFDSDGNLRDDAPSPLLDESETAPTSSPKPAPGGQLNESVTVPPGTPPAPVEGVEAVDEDEVIQKSARRLNLADEALLKFIEEQYVGGLLALGAMPEPQSGQMVEDLDLARLRVEVLTLLQESTEGERTDDTTKALEDVLYQLRMAYLQKRKVAKL